MAGSSLGDVAVLDADTCWDLVAGAEVGRLAVAVERQPDIFPVNFVVDDRSVVFCTAEGTKFCALVIDRSVAFEVDGYDADTDQAWSVVLKGRAAEIPMYEVPDDAAFALVSWMPSPKSRFVRIFADAITGRRFRVAQRRQRAAATPSPREDG